MEPMPSMQGHIRLWKGEQWRNTYSICLRLEANINEHTRENDDERVLIGHHSDCIVQGRDGPHKPLKRRVDQTTSPQLDGGAGLKILLLQPIHAAIRDPKTKKIKDQQHTFCHLASSQNAVSTPSLNPPKLYVEVYTFRSSLKARSKSSDTFTSLHCFRTLPAGSTKEPFA
jgi:hypothetical protein